MTHTWRPATGNDIPNLVDLSSKYFSTDVEEQFTINLNYLAKHIAYGVVNQFYTPHSELLSIAEDQDGKLLGYTWARSGERASWSTDCVVNVMMVHIDQSLSPRYRVTLIKEMMSLWEAFAYYAGVPIICSGTMRIDQTAFLKLHAKYGYSVRGNVAYKRLDLTKPPTPL